MTLSMQCFIYRSQKSEETYVFLPKKDTFDVLPEDIRRKLGQLTFIMEMTLTPERKLARTQGENVMRDIGQQGFYLQLPPKDIQYLV